MEKFRKWGDAATGIHPFVFPMEPVPTMQKVLCAVAFPFRVLIGLLLCLVLFLCDVLSHTLRVAHLRWVATLLLMPLATVICRLLLYVVCGMAYKLRVLPPKPQPQAASMGGSNSASMGGSNGGGAAGDFLECPKPGDLILCNLQSPVDILALRCAPPIAVFSSAGQWGGAMDFVLFAFYDPVAATKGAPIAEFCPSPFQWWKAMRFAMHLSKSSSILGTSPTIANATGSAATPVCVATTQRRAARLGVPVVFFAEGTTSNGRAILPLPQMEIATRIDGSGVHRGAGNRSKHSNRPCATFLAALHYHGSPGAARVLDHNGSMGFLFDLTARCEGGAVAAVTVARPSAGMVPLQDPDGCSNGSDVFETTPAWLMDCRQRMAALVQYRNPSVVCKPVSVGLSEKVSFVQQWQQTVGGTQKK